ncbi:hypothetical protein LR48_Vigan04g075400 [Vigna angularis]|uniref:Uncharacterized protein n=1 Tax=Phaseolus angularis TaxID=3914 RepID=A0A0L9UCY1_PHAAN|nr:hypothetical protein LR48_Vigan04g075400 [Vigna angularis]
MVSFLREKVGFLERRRRTGKSEFGKEKVHAEESGTEAFRKISFLSTSKRASALLLSPAFHYLISDPRFMTPGVSAEGNWVRFNGSEQGFGVINEIRQVGFGCIITRPDTHLLNCIGFTLDNELQHALKEYLIVKGIGVSLTNFLLHYLHKREQEQYVNWLKKGEAAFLSTEGSLRQSVEALQ